MVAGVAESADALDSKSGTRKGVWVRPPPPAPPTTSAYDSTLDLRRQIGAGRRALLRFPTPPANSRLPLATSRPWPSAIPAATRCRAQGKRRHRSTAPTERFQSQSKATPRVYWCCSTPSPGRGDTPRPCTCDASRRLARHYRAGAQGAWMPLTQGDAPGLALAALTAFAAGCIRPDRKRICPACAARLAFDGNEVTTEPERGFVGGGGAGGSSLADGARPIHQRHQ